MNAEVAYSTDTPSHTLQLVERYRTHQKKMRATAKAHTPQMQTPVSAQAVQAIRPTYRPKFNWKHSTQKVSITPTLKTPSPTGLPSLAHGSDHVLALLGYKVDISVQVDIFKQKLQKFYIESKSHNALVGKFSQLKFGLTVSVLSLLQVPPSQIEELKESAIATAVSDNIDCFSQNEYNIELLTIFSNQKKDKGRLKILTELRKQLIQQMAHYGYPDHYTKDTIYRIKQAQIQIIFMDLLEEQQNLRYLRQFQ
jgi:hypothetical protein